MASVNITITRDNNTNISGSGTVPDELLINVTEMLGAMLFDAATTPSAPAPAPETS